MSGHEIDPASLELVLQLQIQDAQCLLKRKFQEDETSDTELALKTYKTELESVATCVSDRAMSRSIARAVGLDGNAISEHAEAEQQAAHDRDQALNLDTPGAAQIRAAPEEEILDDDSLNRLKTFNGDEEVPSTITESSSSALQRENTPTAESTSHTQYRKCTSCSANVPFLGLVRCPCEHDYCGSCIVELFTISISDESLFPPRCCKQPIPLTSSLDFLSPKLVEKFQAKELEYGTPNRTYCHQAACSEFVPPQSIQGDNATCVRCKSQTCVKCKGVSHDGDCPEDVVTEELLAVAAENGWQRCLSCHQMVELITGCNHITCICGGQFCYKCGVLWKNCQCDMWDENRLLERANAIVNRDAARRQLVAADLAVLVEHERVNMINNHECVHPRWKSRGGHHTCEECHHRLHKFIYECRQCRILACRRCRYNRL